MKITVFTPTYNRAYIIETLYRSLQRQTFTDFEWLVVDDGSSDNTQELFDSWIAKKNSFTIRYYKQPNGGKCRAINRALDLANGELFFTVDSDDYLTDDALKKIAEWDATLPRNQKFCGVAGNLGTSPTETPNTLFAGDYLDGTALDRYRNIDGERAMVFYTSIHRKYKYPAFDGENFITEAVAWNRMAHDGYLVRYYNDIIWVYEYKEDGLTKAGSSLFLNNPRGYGLWLREKAEFEHLLLGEKFKMYYTFTCDLSKKYSVSEISDFIDVSHILISLFYAIHSFKQVLFK